MRIRFLRPRTCQTIQEKKKKQLSYDWSALHARYILSNNRKNKCERLGHIVKQEWSGFVKGGFVKHGFVKGGFVKGGFVKDGFVKGGFVKDGFVKRGFVKDGFVKGGFFSLNLFSIKLSQR